MDPLTAQHSSISPCGGGVPLLSACRLPSGSRPVARIPAPRRLMEKANGSRAPAGSNTPGVAPCARRARRVCRGRPPGRRRCPRRGAGDCQCSRDGAASVNRGRLAERGSEVEDGEECLTSEPLLPSIVRQRLVQLQSPPSRTVTAGTGPGAVAGQHVCRQHPSVTGGSGDGGASEGRAPFSSRTRRPWPGSGPSGMNHCPGWLATHVIPSPVFAPVRGGMVAF